MSKNTGKTEFLPIVINDRYFSVIFQGTLEVLEIFNMVRDVVEHVSQEEEVHSFFR
jgi:hypothetical protein